MPERDPAVQAAIEGELRLLDPEVRRSPELLGALLHPEFHEFGSSGSRWDRASTLARLPLDTDPYRYVVTSPIHGVRLGPDVVRDDKGFVVTGQDLLVGSDPPVWPLARAPFALETSVPGVFAAGDVRLDSMKRVASAVGEGAMSVHHVHQYLATI